MLIFRQSDRYEYAFEQNTLMPSGVDICSVCSTSNEYSDCCYQYNTSISLLVRFEYISNSLSELSPLLFHLWYGTASSLCQPHILIINSCTHQNKQSFFTVLSLIQSQHEPQLQPLPPKPAHSSTLSPSRSTSPLSFFPQQRFAARRDKSLQLL
jgi:hypothetical protein